MPYDRDIIDQAKKKGIFEDNVFDPKALELSEEEKNRLQKELSKAASLNTPQTQEKKEQIVREKKNKDIFIDIELNLFEKIIIFILSLLNLSNEEEYKMNKLIKSLENEISRIKPPIYNFSTNRVTKYFAHKIHDLYLRTVFLRNILEIVFDSNIWDNIFVTKTGVEILFERLANINSDEVDNKFSSNGLMKVISDFENSKLATETIEKMCTSYVSSIDKSIVDNVNKIYTNIYYFKNFFEFDFVQLFRKFDPYFTPGSSPNFNDVIGHILVEYLEKLEDAILQIDLQLDNFNIFKELYSVSKKISLMLGKKLPDEESNEPIEERIQKEVLLLYEIIRDLINKRYITLLIQVIKKNPLYSPSIIHNQYDLYKIYSEILQKRVKYLTKKLIKEKNYKKIDQLIKKVFPNIKWCGIYEPTLAKKLEDINISPFLYHYHIGVVNTFIRLYFDEFIKSALNILLLNGNFMEKHFYKTVSETFYNMEKFDAKIIDYSQEYSSDGILGKKFLSLLTKYDGKNSELKKIIERNIVTMNGKAKDIFDEFYNYFVTINDIITKVYGDIESKPPKYIRNIKAIGGFKNSKFLSIIEKSYNVMLTVKEIMTILKDLI